MMEHDSTLSKNPGRMSASWLVRTLVVMAMLGMAQIAHAEKMPDDMVRYAKAIGDICGMKLDNDAALRKVMGMPAFFWLSSESALRGELTQTELMALRPAVDCHSRFGIEVKAETAKQVLPRLRG